MLAGAEAARGACTTPENIALVDAAFERQGGPEQRKLEAEVCPTCPIWDACLAQALKDGEHGPWGGTSKRARTKVTGVRPYRFNMRDVEHGHVPSAAVAQKAAIATYHGVTLHTIKEWAVDVGLIPYVYRGTVKPEVIEAYHQAHS